MNLEIKLFATLRDRAGHNTIQITLEQPASVQDLLDGLSATHPELAAALPTTLVAVNKQFAFPDTPIQTDDEIALFPPVSGGDLPYPTYFAISPAEVDFNAIYQHIGGPDVGAIASFTGFVPRRFAVTIMWASIASRWAAATVATVRFIQPR